MITAIQGGKILRTIIGKLRKIYSLHYEPIPGSVILEEINFLDICYLNILHGCLL